MKIALTFDDFPCKETESFRGMNSLTLTNTLNILKKHEIRNVHSFVNDVLSQDKEQEFNASCQQWLASGHCLANHTFSHLNLSGVASDMFIQDIKKLEPILDQFQDQNTIRYFRYPHLSMGTDLEKYQSVKTYLHNHNYQIAPVTIDTKDYVWASHFNKTILSDEQTVPTELEASFLQFASDGLLYSKMLADFVFKRPLKHIVLLHFNYFTSLMLEKLIVLYKQNDVKFISLEEAMTDSAYQVDSFNPSNYHCLFTKNADLNYQYYLKSTQS